MRNQQQYDDGQSALARQIKESLLHMKYEAQGLSWKAAKQRAAEDMAQQDLAQQIHDQTIMQQRRAQHAQN